MLQTCGNSMKCGECNAEVPINSVVHCSKSRVGVWADDRLLLIGARFRGVAQPTLLVGRLAHSPAKMCAMAAGLIAFVMLNGSSRYRIFWQRSLGRAMVFSRNGKL